MAAVNNNSSLEKDSSQQFQCPQCVYKGSQKRYVDEHVQRVHSLNIKMHHCQQCDYKSKANKGLTIHVNSVHLKIKHPCPQCGFKAARLSSLRSHIKSIHEKEPKYPCSFCSIELTKEYLKRHIKNVHKRDPLQSKIDYQCEKCDYKAFTQKKIKLHINSVHEGIKYPCKLCR